jgi:glycosyltransferase involved in cell wall biosynthesis
MPSSMEASRARIAILMPQAWHGGMERNAWALAEILSGLKAPDGRPIDVLLGLHADGGYDWAALKARAEGLLGQVSVRPLRWTQRSGSVGPAMFGDLVPEGVGAMGLPVDGLYGFQDTDAWIVFSTTYEGFVPALRPLAVYAADHVHRYVPLPAQMLTQDLIDANDDTLRYWRESRCVFSTTPGTVSDTVSFAGVSAARARLMPNLVDPVAGVAARPPRPPGNYILWVTNTSPHKNHAKALEALKIYWTQLGGSLDVVICGSYTDTLKPGSGAKHDLTQGLEKGMGWASRVRFAGHIDDDLYFDLVSGSAFVWHNVIIDNGTFVAFDAARAGRFLVSSDYPAMRYLANHYGFEASWFPASDPMAAAQALIQAERKVSAGLTPNHQLQADDPDERAKAYQDLADILLTP